MQRASLIFCIGSVLSSLALAAALYPLSAVSKEQLRAATTPAAAEALPDLQLGEFGSVPVSDLVSYYIENPPASGSLPSSEVHFQGC